MSFSTSRWYYWLQGLINVGNRAYGYLTSLASVLFTPLQSLITPALDSIGAPEWVYEVLAFIPPLTLAGLLTWIFGTLFLVLTLFKWFKDIVKL